MSLRPDSRYPWFEPRIVAVVVIAAAAVWSTSIFVGGWKATHASAETAAPQISVDAQATRRLVPDRVTWKITSHSRADTRDEATSQLHTATTAVRAYLVAQGVPEVDLSVKEMTVDGNDRSEGEAAHFDATQDIEIASTDIARNLRLHARATAGDDERDAAVDDADIGEPTCTATNSDVFERDLLDDAQASVRARAERAVRHYGGAHLGRLVRADFGRVDVSTACNEIVLTATATATYELD
jgi:uncharacterized protein YggE